MEIHPKAMKLLGKILENDGEVSADDIVGMSHGEIIRPAKWLEEEKMAKVNEKKTINYFLTEKGQNAFDNGLPEEVLLKKLQDNPQKIKDLAGEIEAFNVALGQSKKNGWIEIKEENGEKELSITKKGEKKIDEGFKENKVLRKIKENEVVDKKLIEPLMERDLIDSEEKVEHVIKITKKGKKFYSENESEEEKIGNLNTEHLKSGEWKERGIRKYNVEIIPKAKRPGKKQPYRQYLDEVRRKFTSMGFREAKTPYVETEFWNFDALFQAQDHPAREIHDKFELENPEYGDLEHTEIVERVKEMHEKGGDIESEGWNYEWSRKQASKLMMRSQTTATTIRYLARDIGTPAKVFAIDRNFRYDEIDKTHFIEFYQAEGIVKAENLSLKNLFGYLEVFGKEIAGAEKIRFRPNYFPFTEPSVELDAYHPEIGWVELGGAGLFRPEVRSPLGVDVPVIAWGMGIDRIAMFKLGKEDIRELVFPQNIEELRNTRAVRLR